MKQPSPVVVKTILYDRFVKGRPAFAYPPDTKAFLYYSIPQGRPRIAGELRLRVTSSDDAASFESGSDLLLSDGQQPWSRSLYFLSKYCFPLYKKLREDQLVPDDLDKALATLPSKRHQFRGTTTLYTLNDTFIVDFSNYKMTFFVITEKGVEKLVFMMFIDTRCRNRPNAIYTGAYTNDHLWTLLILIIFMNL